MHLESVYTILFVLSIFRGVSSLSIGGVGLREAAKRSLAASLIAASFVSPIQSVAATDGYYNKAQGFYDSWNSRDVGKAISYFADDVYFVDAQYSEPFEGKTNVQKYLQECADSLPGWKFIIDDYSEDLGRRRVGLKWHVSDSSKTPLPFPSRG
jgi:SnoaL-like domain